MLVQEAKVQKDNFNTITATIKPVLDCVDVEPAPRPDGRQQGPETVVGFVENLCDPEEA